MKDANELKKFILEAQTIQDDWRTDAKEWTRMYRGIQWDDDDKAQLESEQRPVLTLNIIRPLVRLLTGIERISRYDIKVLPIGEGTDHDIARLYTAAIKQVEDDQKAQYTYSEAYKNGLVTGRGWIRTDINTDRNIWGDITLEDIDPYEMWIDPYTRKYDMSDTRYLIRELYLTKDEVISMYPKFKNKIDKFEVAAPEYGDNIAQHKETYKFYEIWYREYKDQKYVIRQSTGDIIPLEKNQVKEVTTVVDQSLDMEVVTIRRPEMYFAVISNDEIVEQEPSPYRHNLFPYTPFFSDFSPRFGEEKPKWSSIVTDLIDPQKEKNKRRSLWTDILIRFVNKGFIFEEGIVVNEDMLDEIGRTSGFKIKLKSDGTERFTIVEGSAPDQALLNVDTFIDKDINQISGVPPSLRGYEESSRESGRTIMLRQQQGNAAISPFTDNMRMTRQMVTRQILSLIQQVYSIPRMVRMFIDTGDNQGQSQQQVTPEQQRKLQAIHQLKGDTSVARYDVDLGDTSSTPTTRQAEFVELIELVKQGLIPPTPAIMKLIVKTSDVSVKNELLDVLEQEMQQAKEEAQQQKIQDAVLGGKAR